MPDTLSELIERLATSLRTINLASLDNVALGPGQWRVLLAILDNPGVRSHRLAALLGLDRSTISRTVSHLLRAGYVKKKPLPGNRKSFALIPANMAAVFGVEIEDRLKHDEDLLSRCFSEQEILQFRQFLLRAQGALGEHLPTPPSSQVGGTRYQRKDSTCASFS